MCPSAIFLGWHVDSFSILSTQFIICLVTPHPHTQTHATHRTDYIVCDFHQWYCWYGYISGIKCLFKTAKIHDGISLRHLSDLA